MRAPAVSVSFGQWLYRGAEILIVVFGAGVGAAGLALLPQASHMRAAAEVQRIHDVNSAHDHFCEKWGLARGSAAHTGCTVDLKTIRDDEARYVTAQWMGLL